MKARSITCLVAVLALPVVFSVSARADEAADKKAEIQRKKEEAKKQAAEKQKASAAAKDAADAAAAADKKAADAKKAAEDAKLAAEKAAADKKAAAGAGGTSGTGAASSGGATSTGGTSGKGGAGSGGAGGKTSASSTAKVEEKDAPLPAGDIATLRKDRADRRKVTVERLRKRWGSVLADAKGAADLKQHSRRVAYLQRARIVAEAKKDKKSVELVDQLLTAEDERHSTAMNALREGALAGTNK